MSVISKIKGCNYVLEFFISLLNVLGLLWLGVLVCMYCYINFEEKKMVSLIYVSLPYRIVHEYLKYISTA